MSLEKNRFPADNYKSLLRDPHPRQCFIVIGMKNMSREKIQSKLTKRIIIGIAAVMIFYIVLGFLPRAACQKLEDSGQLYFQHQEDGQVMVRVEKGGEYSIALVTSTAWNTGIDIQVYRNSYRVVGIRTITIDENIIRLYFTAKKDGYYYVIIGFKGIGYYDLYFGGYNYIQHGYIQDNFVNFWNLMLVLSPLFLCSVLAWVFIRQYQRDISEIGLNFLCRSCGTQLAKGTDYCKYCGYTYSTPKTLDSK